MPPDWDRWIEAPLFDHELTRLRTCVNRQAPFGIPEWQAHVAKQLGLASTLRPQGRPRKPSPENGD
jgi:putative transposase